MKNSKEEVNIYQNIHFLISKLFFEFIRGLGVELSERICSGY